MQEEFPAGKLSEHLKEGIKPIMVSLGSVQEYRKFKKKSSEEYKNIPNPDNNFGLGKQGKSIKNIEFGGDLSEMIKNNFLNAGGHTYVISTLDDSDKKSTGAGYCTGLVVTGIDKDTGKNISFLTHQELNAVLSSTKNEFIRDLQKRLNDVKKQCTQGTIDAVIVGGIVLKSHMKSDTDLYLRFVKAVSSQVKATLGFEPVVVNGPKAVLGRDEGDDYYYDNDNRRLYLVRPEVNTGINAFLADDAIKYKDKF